MSQQPQRDRHRTFLERIGMSMRELAARSGVKYATLRNFLEPRKTELSSQKKAELLETVAKAIPEDERTGFARVVASQQLGNMADVLDRLERDNRRLRAENSRLRAAILAKDNTPMTESIVGKQKVSKR
jgi:lambda repressor-like predicted transcriptional regulator